MKIQMSDIEHISTVIRRAILECSSDRNSDLLVPESVLQLYQSPACEALKREIVRTGKKLWQREYVDGNGGNISARISPNYVLCTPTLCSKEDLCIRDLSLVDLDNRKIIGTRPQTSEILLHLEIYKAVPEAKAVIHSHPPHATAHSLAGIVPQGDLLPEQEVFIGPVAVAPYETPGTLEFARTVLPFVKQHNTILLENHGIVCWADTVTHAEWYTEVFETYCKTVMIANQLGVPLKAIPPHKIPELLAIKKRLGLPDARLPQETQAPKEVEDLSPKLIDEEIQLTDESELEALVQNIAAQIADFMEQVHEPQY